MKTILCYGDSNTWGYDCAALKNNFPGRFDAHTRWTGILAGVLGNSLKIIEEGLNARTTVMNDPFCDYRSGRDYLVPCLDSQRPLDLVIIMLGTNDLKVRFSAAPADIISGAEMLIDITQRSKAGVDGSSPSILIVAPPPIGTFLPADEPSWIGAQKKCLELPSLYAALATRYNCHFANSHDVLTVEDLDSDGLHLSVAGHAKLGKFLANEVEKIFVKAKVVAH